MLCPVLSDRSNGRIYVETTVRGDLATLWARSQDPRQHQRWDLRFTTIEPAGPGSFRYAVRVLPGIEISGTGTHGGERHRPDGSATSVLRFASSHPLSLLRAGSGFWRYVPSGREPDQQGVRFVTGYDYEVRWGIAGRAADLVLRPLMGWGTAWSFDRLRLWVEHGITPERALRTALVDAGLRVATVALAARRGPSAALATAVLTLALPPSPRTPAARRCRRRPPTDRRIRT